MLKRLNTIKVLTVCVLTVAGILFSAGHADATDPPIGDVVQFAPLSNWSTWFIRYLNETGHGQKFLTGANTQAISTVAFKLCRNATMTKQKTLTLCSSATNGYYAGCQTPLGSRTFSASELNAMINYDVNCPGNLEGGANDGTYFKWSYFTFTSPITVSTNTSYFIMLNSASSADNEPTDVLRTMYNNSNYLGSSENYPNGQAYYYKGSTRYTTGESTDLLFKIYSADPITIPFEITSPLDNDPAEVDTWVTVTGTCPTNGVNRIGFGNDCLGFDDINYNISCTSNTFSGQFFYDGQGDKRLIAREIDSVSGDCADYDDLMDYKTLRTIEIIEGYPDDWYFNFDYYDDYDIKIKSPQFDTALTLPAGSTSASFTFGFIYPTSSTLSNLNFHIKQYDSNGVLLDENYHNKDLDEMADTWNYTISLTASSTQAIHYVVQLTYASEMKRQYPFGIFVSDLDFSYNPDDYDYFFPRLKTMLRSKIIFNYYFAFHDGFYDMFNADYTSAGANDLDITFKTMSGDGQYNLDMKIFSASDSRVKNFASGLRPYITAILWLVFAVYVIFRITHLFSDNE